MSATTAHAMLHLQDPDWTYDLSGVFQRVVLDEAQLVKNALTMSANAVLWLSAKFHLCLSATPLHNSINDFNGFEKFLFPFNSDAQWSPEQLAKMSVDDDVNSFELPQEHPASSLMATTRGMKEFIWDASVSGPVKGQRLGHMWRKCLIRRTLMSRIPFDTGQQIGADIPVSQYRIVDCPFTPAEQTTYNEVSQPFYRRLVVKHPVTNKLMWDMGKFRKLVLLTTWVHFGRVEGSIKASNMARAVKLITEKTLLPRWVSKVRNELEGPGTFNIDNPNAIEESLVYILRGSPRLRKFLPIICDQVLRLREKAIVFCLFPGNMSQVAGFLISLDIDAKIYHARLTPNERQELVREFNESIDSCMVLILSYAINSAGLNLQARCRNCHLIDLPLSEATLTQAIGRIRRIGQTKIVKVYEYRVPNSFNIKQATRNAEKAIPGLFAELDDSLFSISEGGDGGMVMGNWGIDGSGQLVRWGYDEDQPEGVTLASPDQIMHRIMNLMKGC